MSEVFFVAFLGGIVTGFSPCIVPVAPIVLAGGASGGARSRPVFIVAGLVVSFSLTELVGTLVLSSLHLPDDVLYYLGIALLGLLALGLLVPPVARLSEWPLRRLHLARPPGKSRGFVFGLGLGLVFVPCAGPVLAAISAASANHRVNADTLLVTLSYALGAGIPLLVLGLVAERATHVFSALRARLSLVRRCCGVLLGLTTLFLALGTFDPLQRAVPSYTSALENRLESDPSVLASLARISGEGTNHFVSRQIHAHQNGAPMSANALPRLGEAPGFRGITAWLNTKDGRPLSLRALRGKVVLVDFWTYSCINCQRALPHVEAWYRTYRHDGLVVIGVHTPEFSFEHVVSNVVKEAAALGVHYPVAIDDNYATWDAYHNNYWPADYLIDATGEVRAVELGEGGYHKLESDIRALLVAAGHKHLPAPTDVAVKTPTGDITPESYLGYDRLDNAAGAEVVPNAPVAYVAPARLATNTLAFSGTWDDHAEEATATRAASIRLHFSASDVYLVLAGKGTVTVAFDHKKIARVAVSGVPRLYRLYSAQKMRQGELELSFTKGLKAYDFTFG